MKKLFAANWKENPKNEAEALRLFRATVSAAKRAKVDVIVCPPFVYIEALSRAYKRLSSKRGIALGAQDVFWEEGGAFTSEVGPKMLRSFGVTHVIVGHSERRKYLKETDAMINKKIKLALADKVRVILCVGEALAVRRKGAAAAEAFVKGQLKKDLAGIPRAKVRSMVTIAYEPIWAIGTGRNADPETTIDMARCIRVLTNARVLYGGSVKGSNIKDYVQYKEIDGALVGGASIKAREIKKIIKNI